MSQSEDWSAEAAEISKIIKGWGLEAPEIGELNKSAHQKVVAALRWADDKVRDFPRVGDEKPRCE